MRSIQAPHADHFGVDHEYNYDITFDFVCASHGLTHMFCDMHQASSTAAPVVYISSVIRVFL